MTAVLVLARHRLRRHSKAVLAFGLLLAVAGGLVAAVAAGADRASSAFSRLEAANNAPDGYIFLPGVGDMEQRVEHLPEVRQAAYAYGLAPSDTDFTPVVLPDPRFGRTIDRFKFLSGRRPAGLGEAMVDFTLAHSRHLHVGDTVTLRPPSGGAPTRPAPIAVRVVGVVADARAFPPVPYANQQSLYLDGSFLDTPEGAAWARADGGAAMVAVRLSGGAAQLSAFMDDVQKLAGDGNPVGSDTESSIATAPQRSMQLQALALWLTAGFGALVLLVIMAQLLLRQLAEHAVTVPPLRSLGMTNAELVGADVLWTAAVAVGGAVVAAGVAYAASPLFPLGTARVAEPSPGATFDAPVVLPALALVALAVVGVGTVAAVRLTARRRPGYVPAGGSRSVFLPPLQRLPVVVSTGVRMALRPGRGRSSVPVRSAIGAAAVGIAGVIVAMTFSSSLGHLLSTPPLYGTTFDADVEVNGNFQSVEPLLPAVEAYPGVEAVALAETGVPLISGGTHFGAEMVRDVKGSILPTVVSGRLPEAPDEILLGVQTMSTLHTRIGRSVPVAIDGISDPLPMRVVGSGVLATTGDNETLGKGSVVAESALPRFMSRGHAGVQAPPFGDLFVRFGPGADPARAIPALTARLGGVEKVIITAPTQPNDVADFGQVKSLPQVLAGLLAGLAAVTMAYLLVSAVRRRRRELALLKTLGFVPAQISAAVAWQATTVAVVATVVGLPMGIVVGRAVWTAVAHQMGVVVSTQVPWLLLGLLVPAVIVLANVVAAGPAVVAARISASTALRDE